MLSIIINTFRFGLKHVFINIVLKLSHTLQFTLFYCISYTINYIIMYSYTLTQSAYI